MSKGSKAPSDSAKGGKGSAQPKQRPVRTTSKRD